MDMMLTSVISWQPSRFNDSSPVQWVDIDMMLTSVMLWQHRRFNDSSPIQWADIDMMHLLSDDNHVDLMIVVQYNE